MTHPSGTAYERDLYSAPELEVAQRNFLEARFFAHCDQIASDALGALEADGGQNMTTELRSGWSRFIRSLNERSPNRLAYLRKLWADTMVARREEIRQNWHAFRRESDPVTFKETELLLQKDHADAKGLLLLLQRLIDSPETSSFVNNMIWSVLKIHNTDRSFLTSDRPVIMSNGIAYWDSSIVVPIGPKSLFVAANTNEALSRVNRIPCDRIVTWINDRAARQAERLVFGTNDRQLRFVENRLRQPISTHP